MMYHMFLCKCLCFKGKWPRLAGLAPKCHPIVWVGNWAILSLWILDHSGDIPSYEEWSVQPSDACCLGSKTHDCHFPPYGETYLSTEESYTGLAYDQPAFWGFFLANLAYHPAWFSLVFWYMGQPSLHGRPDILVLSFSYTIRHHPHSSRSGSVDSAILTHGKSLRF